MGALLAGLCLLAAACSGSAKSAELPERPHIVVFLADDLGWSDVGYHQSEIDTPTIDALAADGVRLEALYASPTCSPTRAALMTGRYPMRYGLQSGVLRPHSNYGLPLEERTLADLLREAGYETAICGKWHLGFFEPAYRPTQRGFDHQYGCYNGAIDYLAKTRFGGVDWHRDDQPLISMTEMGGVERAESEVGYVTDLIAREAVRVIEGRDTERPLFLYVPFTAPHAPLQAPAEEIERLEGIEDINRRAYAAMVHRLDARIATVLGALEASGMRENTLVVFASDNGGDPLFGGSNVPLSGGKRELGEGGLRVPGIVSWPGVLEARSVNEPISFVDWLPTFAALAGVDLAGGPALDGVDLAPVLTGGTLEREELLLHLEPDRAALRSGAWKLVRHGTFDQEPTNLQLFDVVYDPSETNDKAAERTDVVRRMSEALDAFAAQAAPARGWPNDPPPENYRPPAVWGQGQDED